MEGIGHIILTYRTEEEEGKEVAKGRKGGGGVKSYEGRGREEEGEEEGVKWEHGRREGIGHMTLTYRRRRGGREGEGEREEKQVRA